MADLDSTRMTGERVGVQGPENRPHDAGTDEDHHVGHEEVRGHGEDAPGLADPAQVDVRDQDDQPRRDPNGAVVAGECREHRRESGNARCHRDGDGEGVVDEKGHDCDLSHLRPEVLPRDHVRAACLRVDLHDLEVGQRHEDQDGDHREGDWHDEGERCDPDRSHENEEDLLGRVRGRRDDVRGQHRQGGRTPETFGGLALGRDRRAEEAVLQPVADRLREPFCHLGGNDLGRCDRALCGATGVDDPDVRDGNPLVRHRIRLSTLGLPPDAAPNRRPHEPFRRVSGTGVARSLLAVLHGERCTLSLSDVDEWGRGWQSGCPSSATASP